MERKRPTSETGKCPTFTKFLIFCDVMYGMAPRRGLEPLLPT